MVKCSSPLPLLCAFITLLIEWRVFERIRILVFGEFFRILLRFQSFGTYVMLSHQRLGCSFIRSYVRIAISRKRHFRSPKRKNENTLRYKVPPTTWENSPQKPLLATRKWFFGHCYVQNLRFLKILQCPHFEIFW